MTHEEAELIYSKRILISGCLGQDCGVRPTATSMRELAWERIGVVLNGRMLKVISPHD